MRGSMWQIAFREYLSYVGTWGFWISLALIPVFMSLGFIFPLLAQQSEPVRYFAVIAEDARYETAVADRLAESEKSRARTAVLAIIRTADNPGLTEEEARDLFEAAPDWESARVSLRERLDPQLHAGLDALGAFQGKLRLIEAPATTPDAVRPYLLGERLIDTPSGPQTLHAAAFIRADTEDGMAVDYWSAQITNTDARIIIERAVRDQMREDGLMALGVAPSEADAILTARPKVQEFSPERERTDAKVSVADRAPYLVALGMALLLWTSVFSVVNMLLSSTIEEKANNILDSLLATVKLGDILVGKLVGVAMVSGTLLLVWGGVGVLGLLGAQDAARGLPAAVLDAVADPTLLIAFVAYFVFGYLMYGAAFIALGSLCESIHEAQTLLTPIILFMMGPIIAVFLAMRNPEGWLMKAMSWFPLYTPFVMPMRLPTDVPLIEIVATTLAVIATTVLVLHLATRIFHAGAVAGATPATLVRGLAGRRN